jgi:hypothetical protein
MSTIEQRPASALVTRASSAALMWQMPNLDLHRRYGRRDPLERIEYFGLSAFCNPLFAKPANASCEK